MADNELEAIFELGEEREFDCEFTIDAVTFDYEQLDKKPQINGETLIGNKTSEELHLASSEDVIRLEQNIQSESTTRAENDTLLQNNINTLDEKVDGINVNLTQQINELEQDVNDKYNELVRDIDDLTDVVEEDYNTLNQRITDVADELQQSIEENVVALQQEDTALQNQINAHSTTLTAYDTRITNNANAISQEVIDRQNADDNLQEQIDGITAGSDVKDIVGTYAELQAYDKSKLGNNDIIKVLQDETKENASTYYRYVASTQSFTYIGKEGPFYTKSETDVLLNTKQNTINDLVTIRNNASDGKIASDTIATYGDIVTHNADEFATTTALTQGLATKQNTLISGTNIKTLNNQSLLGSGNIEIKADLDNLTTSLNSENKIQSIGSILQSGGYQKYWQGTKAEYEAIQVKDDNTLYEVLDDIVDVVTEIPTATVNDIGLVKPDNTTITVDDTGTISVKNSFANMNLSNVSNAYDWAIYSVTYGGGESGYTKYRNKRLEQWGVTNASANGESEITMHLPFKDMNYSVFIEMRETGDFFHYAIPSGVQKFKVRVKGANGNFYGAKFQWRAYGYYE